MDRVCLRARAGQPHPRVCRRAAPARSVIARSARDGPRPSGRTGTRPGTGPGRTRRCARSGRRRRGCSVSAG